MEYFVHRETGQINARAAWETVFGAFVDPPGELIHVTSPEPFFARIGGRKALSDKQRAARAANGKLGGRPAYRFDKRLTPFYNDGTYAVRLVPTDIPLKRFKSRLAIYSIMGRDAGTYRLTQSEIDVIGAAKSCEIVLSVLDNADKVK